MVEPIFVQLARKLTSATQTLQLSNVRVGGLLVSLSLPRQYGTDKQS